MKRTSFAQQILRRMWKLMRRYKVETANFCSDSIDELDPNADHLQSDMKRRPLYAVGLLAVAIFSLVILTSLQKHQLAGEIHGSHVTWSLHRLQKQQFVTIIFSRSTKPLKIGRIIAHYTAMVRTSAGSFPTPQNRMCYN